MKTIHVPIAQRNAEEYQLLENERKRKKLSRGDLYFEKTRKLRHLEELQKEKARQPFTNYEDH